MITKSLETVRVPTVSTDGEHKLHKLGEGISAYFPAGYGYRNYKPGLVAFFSKYRDSIQRVHVPPEYNIKNFKPTMEFLRFLVNHLDMAGFEGRIDVDLHTGHGIPLEQVEKYVQILNGYLEKAEKPSIRVSIENTKKSALSSIDEIREFARYIRTNKLGNVRLTVDAYHLGKVERTELNPLESLVHEMEEDGTLDLVSCLHTPPLKGISEMNDMKKIYGKMSCIVEENHLDRRERKKLKRRKIKA
jgi:hypothetical protein